MTEIQAVKNVGLVLLAPFLPRYFSTLKLLEGDQFRDVDSAKRAAALLQYLATGATAGPDEGTRFNSVLCGLEPDTAISESSELTALESKLSENLLAVVTQNWEALGNMGVESLRAAFLARSGTLRQEQEHWVLEPQAKPFDTLLKHLPWSINQVKLPWMEKAVLVEWKG